MTYDAVISYAVLEAPRADRLEAALRQAGLSVWLDRLTRHLSEEAPAQPVLPPGSEHWKVISNAIDSAATLIVLDSPAWRVSSYCQQELEHALQRGKRVITLGETGTEVPQAAVRLGADDLQGAVEAIRDGLDVSLAHARLTVAANSLDADRRRWSTVASSSDATLLASADLQRLGITLTPDVDRCVRMTLQQSRSRRRVMMATAGTVLVAVASLAVLAVVASRSAQQSSRRAKDASQHVQALADAASSEGAANTLIRLRTAEDAVALEQNSTTVAALRDALASFSEGVTLSGLPQTPPAAVAIANDGRVAAEILPTGQLALVDVTGDVPPRLLPSTVQAGGHPVFSPDASRVAFVRRDDGAAEVVNVSSGRAETVPGTSDLVDVMFISPTRAIAVARDGTVLGFDPSSGRERASRLGSVQGPVRAATIASVSPTGVLSLATLDDDMNLVVSSLGASRPKWQVHLNVRPGPYFLGWESVHVCDGSLSVLTTDMADGAPPAFAIPYTVTPAGHAVATGSLIHSFGLVCLPGGGALASDPLDGEESFPVSGISIEGFTRPSSARVDYAVASSENDQWAAAVGSDGTLRVVDLQAAGHSMRLPSVEVVAPADPPMVVSKSGALENVSLPETMKPIVSPETTGGPVRGPYLDRRLGTVVGVGREVVVVRDAHVVRRVRLPNVINTIRPGEPGRSTVVLLQDGHVMVTTLSGRQATVAVPVPKDLSNAGGVITDAVMVGDSRLALASTNGRLDLVAFPDGREISGRIVSSPGTLVAWSAGGRIVLGEQDGTVQMLNAKDLAVTESRKVLSEGIIDLEGNAAGSLIAAQSRDQVVALAVPELFAVARTPATVGLGSIAFDPSGNDFLVSTDVAFFNGGNEASLVSWPLCAVCSGSVAAIRTAALKLAQPRAHESRSQFVPLYR
jgi:hypothetical protein